MPKKKPLKRVPKFASEDAERAFWAMHDTVGYIDWSQARSVVFPNLRPSTETISLRLPSALLADLKSLANERDVPYQSLLKVFLADSVRRERLSEPPQKKRESRNMSHNERALARLAAEGHLRLATKPGYKYSRSPLRSPKGTAARLIDEDRKDRFE